MLFLPVTTFAQDAILAPGAKLKVEAEGDSGGEADYLNENDVAFVSKDSPHSLAINATCEGHDDPPLDVLTRHLLMGFTARNTLSQGLEQLDGREAMRTHVTAKLDGVPVELLLVVMKKDRCVYDFTYLSPVGRLSEREPDFELILKHFKTGSRT